MQLYPWIENTTITALRIILNHSIVKDHAAGADVSMRGNIGCRMDDIREREADRSCFLVELLPESVVPDGYQKQLVLRVEGCHITRLSNHGHTINDGNISIIEESTVIESAGMLQHYSSESTCSYE